MKWIFLSLCLLVLNNINAQQNYLVVTGKVLLSETEEPLQGASVFAENTTLGTATDAEGKFKLYLPHGGYDVVVTFTGYQSESVRVSSSGTNEPLIFKLRLKEEELGDVVVVASNEVKDGWTKYGDFFIHEFIGQTANAIQCEIKNPEVVKFYYSKRNDRLKIKAADPLIIVNRALGYTIRYSLDSFTHDYSSKISFYTGNPLFEEMTDASDVQKAIWAAARKDAYKGSILNFMRSLYNKHLKEDGFEIQFVVSNNGAQHPVKLEDFYNSLRFNKEDSTGLVTINPFQQNVGVLFLKEKPLPGFNTINKKEPADFQFSILTIAPDETITIEQNGFYFDQTAITISAYWAWEKVGDQLPYDYKED